MVPPPVLSSQANLSFCQRNKLRLPISHKRQKASVVVSCRKDASSKEEHEPEDDDLTVCGCEWYPVTAVDLLNKCIPNAVRVLKRDLVVWWDRNKQLWQVWDDKCPHQFAPLSEGQINERGDLECSKHGWCFAACGGSCIFILQSLEGGASVQKSGRTCVAIYPSIEREGFIWFGPNLKPAYGDTATKNLSISTSLFAKPKFKDDLCTSNLSHRYEQSVQNLVRSGRVHYAAYGPHDTSNASEERAELVPYHDNWPTSFAALPGGGQIVSDFSVAWDGLAGRLSPSVTSGQHMQLILSALKLTFSALNRVPGGRRFMLMNSLAIAYTLADLQMDARVMAAGLLRLAVEAGLLGISLVSQELGRDVGRLLHDCIRFKRTLDQMDLFDEESARAVRRFCLSYHDITAIIIEFSSRLQQMRLAHDLPRYQQQILALEALQIHAPLAHAIGKKEVSSELEDLAFKTVLPDSYEFLNIWLNCQWPDEKSVLEECKLRLSSALEQDEKLKLLTEGYTVLGRLKSRFSMMKKLLKDGRKPEEVYDVMGLRVVVTSKMDSTGLELIDTGRTACYRVLEIVRSLWEEVPGRLKDYVAYPKANGYESLHVAVYLTNPSLYQPTMELQIRTSSMDSKANEGDASHALYKGGLTDPGQAQQLKKLMMAAADRAALSLKELDNDVLLSKGLVHEDHMFLMFDTNKDGKISMSEFQQVMGDLGVDRKEVQEFVQLVDVNRDGSVSAEEFAEFKKKVSLLQDFDKRFINRMIYTLREYNAGRQ
ncbi:hypothetical protein GOP47_0025025 [Adiantum capillus-veneris]|uniref:GTP diphosphokinase n=1 Tax=Adiantum capillus-veneris TaxID=13818 RepID=A0A9D4U386_ADICA|nr:hypothetical protein GOP47_0025025 [Adiantum capillus-veneris]